MEIKIGTIGFGDDSGKPRWADTGWRECVDCGSAFWDSDDTRTTCCDRKLTLDDHGRIVWTTK